ncbi:hypothetical protein EN797_039040, partial [Mesorhizobium sp. M2E.F.Ca.ET.154.01.1.1]
MSELPHGKSEVNCSNSRPPPCPLLNPDRLFWRHLVCLLADGWNDGACIDKRGPLQGSTTATRALVLFEIDQPLTKLSKMIGGA